MSVSLTEGTASTSMEVQNRNRLAEMEIDCAHVPSVWDSSITTQSLSAV